MSLSPRRTRSVFFLVLAVLLVVGVVRQQHEAAASSEKVIVVRQQQPENLTLKHSLSGKAPKGNWSVAAIPEIAQATDTTTPVVVSGLISLFGKKEVGRLSQSDRREADQPLARRRRRGSTRLARRHGARPLGVEVRRGGQKGRRHNAAF
ncbi:MAG TPA: hypothetical protein VF656_08410 [Pyrinomonadaceae bacterium]